MIISLLCDLSLEDLNDSFLSYENLTGLLCVFFHWYEADAWLIPVPLQSMSLSCLLIFPHVDDSSGGASLSPPVVLISLTHTPAAERSVFVYSAALAPVTNNVTAKLSTV